MNALSDGDVEHLAPDACWSLLHSTDVGRLAVIRPDGVDIFPLNYRVHDEKLYFASAPGSKLVDIARSPVVAFEVDSFGDGARWSVVIRGEARRLNDDREIELSGVHAMQSTLPTTKWNYVRIAPTSITGRRFTPSAPQSSVS
ncbi:pyridoxamine 5'-phosphate oxidase family protein [soil metagenome]